MSTRQKFIAQLGACTRTVNAEIKKQIVEVGAVRTGRMKNNTKVKVDYDFNKELFTIKDVNSTFYYKFVDEGTVHIAPRKITEKTLDRTKVDKAFAKLYDVWIEWLINREFEVIGA
jgi:hypothetical protein